MNQVKLIKKAVLIGIGYVSKPREDGARLEFCHWDAMEMRRFLRSKGYDNIRLLMDKEEDHDGKDGAERRCNDCRRHVACQQDNCPNRKNIIEAMHWLVRDATPSHRLVFYYAGHGCQVEDKDGDEEDGMDEAIIPSDCPVAKYHVPMPQFPTVNSADSKVPLADIDVEVSDDDEAKLIIDDEMRKIMVNGLPKGCRLTAIFDSCHSGTALDLPYECEASAIGMAMSIKEPKVPIQATVISMGACADNGRHPDDSNSLARAFAHAVQYYGKDLTYRTLLTYVHVALTAKSGQRPRLCLSHPVDWDAPVEWDI